MVASTAPRRMPSLLNLWTASWRLIPRHLVPMNTMCDEDQGVLQRFQMVDSANARHIQQDRAQLYLRCRQLRGVAADISRWSTVFDGLPARQ